MTAMQAAGGRLEGRVALVTGAGRGIGRCTAALFAREGASVVVADLDAAGAEESVRQIEAAGGAAAAVVTDVTEPDSVQAAMAFAKTRFGGLDVLFNNAGGSSLKDGPAPDAPLEEFWRTIKLDLFGTYLGCRFAIPLMLERGRGAIVNAASIVALVGYPGRDAYTAAKGGIVALTRSLAAEYGNRNIRVNAVAPTSTRTERVLAQLAADPVSGGLARQHPIDIGDPLDTAYAALYLASDDARIVTGHVLPVDSGMAALRGKQRSA